MVQTKQEASLRSPVLFFPGEGVVGPCVFVWGGMDKKRGYPSDNLSRMIKNDLSVLYFVHNSLECLRLVHG